MPSSFDYWSSFLYPLLEVTYSSLPAVALGSIAGTLVAGCVVAAERRSVPFGKLAPFTGACLLLLLFYPRQISQASLGYLVSLTTGCKFGQSTWGLVVANIPTSAGIAYLLFSTTILLSDYFRLPASFIKNSGSAPFMRTCAIATIPVRQRFALMVAVICCTIAFQAAMTGKTGASTIGSQIQLGLAGNNMPDLERVVLMSTAIAYLILTLVTVVSISVAGFKVIGRAALWTNAKPRKIKLIANASLVRAAVGGTVLVSLFVAVTLHLFLIIRLLGLAHGLLESFGLPTGRLEETWPSFGISNLVGGVFDCSTIGAIVGCLASIVFWFFSLARFRRAPRNSLTSYGPPCFACIAFLPSTFVGSLSLAMPFIGRLLPLLLFSWGAVAAGGFTCLLVSHHLLGARPSRYANLQCTRGFGRAFGYFALEYWALGIAIVFAVLLGNIFDSGYREALGRSSLGGKYITDQGGWDSEHRGLALLIMILAIGAVWIFTSYNVRKSDEMRRVG